MGWFGLWIFISVTVASDAYLFTKGYDTFWYEHKSQAEKRLQEAVVQKAEQEVNIKIVQEKRSDDGKIDYNNRWLKN